MMTRATPRARSWTLTAGATGAAVLLACAQLRELGGPRVRVSVDLSRAAAAAAAAAEPAFRVDLGGRQAAAGPGGSGTGRAADVRGARYGEVPVRAALVAPSGDTLASVAFSQRFRWGHGHWVAAVVGVSRPVGSCTGALALAPVRGGADTLFVTYGSLPDGAAC